MIRQIEGVRIVETWDPDTTVPEWMAHLWDNVALCVALQINEEWGREALHWWPVTQAHLWDNVALWVALNECSWHKTKSDWWREVFPPAA